MAIGEDGDMKKCYFDKKRCFIHCGDTDRDCIGCDYEKVIARSVVTICQYCGKEIVARYPKSFCNNVCRLEWLRNRLSYDSTAEGGMCWGDPIFTDTEYKEVQKMIGVG